MTSREIILANLGGGDAPRNGFTFDGGRLNDFVYGGVRPSGYEQRRWSGEDGIEYYDPTVGKGVVCLFQPSSEAATEAIRFKGLDAEQTYRLTFEDGAHPSTVKSAVELMGKGLQVRLE